MFGLGAPVAMGPLNTAVKFPLAFRWHQNPTIDLFIAIGHQESRFLQWSFAR
jgi:hypothetical protein